MSGEPVSHSRGVLLGAATAGLQPARVGRLWKQIKEITDSTFINIKALAQKSRACVLHSANTACQPSSLQDNPANKRLQKRQSAAEREFAVP